MSPPERNLRIALIVVGLIFVVALAPLMMLWPSSWMWEPRQHEYEQMILGIYVTLGVFLLIASRNPLAHRSLIWFTVWSSAVHGGIMLVQALVDPVDRPNLIGDVPGLLLIALVLGILTARADPARASSQAQEA